ncbi:hypothetical protein PAXINDRAFT_78763, partial [Paxillus involutus ATCC 200175]
DVFTPPAVYDGRKNMFIPRELPLGPDGSREVRDVIHFSFCDFKFNVRLSDATTRGSPGENTGGWGPKVYKIRLTKVVTINPEVLQRFVMGQQSHDNDVLTALMALNVVIRMEPPMKYPFDVRSFFTDRETRNIGGGLVLWRGYFQLVRPAIGRLLVNVNISTGTTYKPDPLLNLCRIPRSPWPAQYSEPALRCARLGAYPTSVSGIRITTTYSGERFRKIPRHQKIQQ